LPKPFHSDPGIIYRIVWGLILVYEIEPVSHFVSIVIITLGILVGTTDKRKAHSHRLDDKWFTPVSATASVLGTVPMLSMPIVS
jgi:hypothetical protein